MVAQNAAQGWTHGGHRADKANGGEDFQVVRPAVVVGHQHHDRKRRHGGADAGAYGEGDEARIAMSHGEVVHADDQSAQGENQHVAGVEQVPQDSREQAPGHAGEGFDREHHANHFEVDAPLRQMRPGEAGQRGQADHVPEIGGDQDVELGRSGGFGQGPVFLRPVAAGAF